MKLKVCGMRENIAAVGAIAPDLMGFIFWEGSARYFSGQMPLLPSGIKKVGVFVDAPVEEVVCKVWEYGLGLVQLHGKESPEYCAELSGLFKRSSQDKEIPKQGLQLIKAFALDKTFNFDILNSYEKHCDYFLFDSKGELPGGNGYAFDWELLRGYTLSKPYFLSGGISPADGNKLMEFVSEPVADLCYAIDINSQFEKEPGLKRVDQITKFKKELGTIFPLT